MTDKKTIGVLLLNLGGPDSIQAVRPFLNNLFSDREIIKLGPSFIQRLIAFFISSLRAQKTKKMYSLIGGKSPILDITTAQAQALEKALNSSLTTIDDGRRTKDEIVYRLSEQSERSSIVLSSLHFKVYIGMRYWHPFIKDTVEKILRDDIKHLIVLTLYPHYSKATTGSAIAEFKKAVTGGRGQGSGVRIQYIEQWYDFPPYIEALAELISEGMSEFKEGDVDVLYSAHSLPARFIREGDPYLDHINATISAVNSLLSTRYSLLLKWHPEAGLREGSFRLSFQSKSGPLKWLQPSTDEMIKKLESEGCKNLLIVPISFVSDHIETLYEIDILYKKLAEKHGINLKRCESLNMSEKFINAMKELVLRETQMNTDKEQGKG